MSRHDPRSGIILVVVLWTIALISALAMAASTTFRGFANIVALDRDRARADALLAAGLEVSAAMVASLGEKTPLTEKTTSVSFTTGSVHIRLSDEGGRINVNKAPEKVLSALLTSAGAGDDANAIAKAIDAWRVRDQADQAAKGPKLASAAAPPPAQTNRSAPQANTSSRPDKNFQSFTDIRQLAQIPGMAPDYLAGILPLATVYGTDQVNALTAPADVIAALPGVTSAQLSAFLDARERSPMGGDFLAQMLGPAKDYVKTGARPIASVILIARLIDGYGAAAKAVIAVVPNDKQPYRILSWTPLAPPTRGLAMSDRF
ncbi:type II secretion system protein GspK [Methyloferula stellata]|uniref:type II secretion system protein GspK n=1 Tax=Methyloferula stellata TaxID=876270 RepID=UPI00036A472D|nr:type II secretion system protein GspK [Methyloferula stellata]